MTRVPAFAVDSSCIVPTICGWHMHHESASREVIERLTAGETMIVPAPALVEAYSVVTRLPSPYTMAPADAWAALDGSFVSKGRVDALGAAAYTALIARLAAAGVGGGRVYDAVIGECATLVGATALVTFNAKHFDPPPAGVVIVDPSGDEPVVPPAPPAPSERTRVEGSERMQVEETERPTNRRRRPKRVKR